MRRRQRPLIKEGRKPSNLHPTLTLSSKTQKKRTDGAWLIETLRSRPIILQEGKANIIQEDFLLSLKRALGRDVRKRLERYFLDFLIRVCGRGEMFCVSPGTCCTTLYDKILFPGRLSQNEHTQYSLTLWRLLLWQLYSGPSFCLPVCFVFVCFRFPSSST